MTLRIGSMFSGYGGLDLAAREAIGGKTVFVADICGNGVVPQQAAYAISHLLARSEAYRNV